MSTALQRQSDLPARPAAGPEQLCLEGATTYLVGAARARTPLGAVEALEMRAHFGGRDGHEERLKLADRTCHLYAELFPREYAASQAPPFSIGREHEFYTLVNSKLFPLSLSGQVGPGYEADLERTLAHNPRFFLPFIPVAGTQQHDWVRGCCGFERIQTVFQLALALIRHEGERGWRYLAARHGLPEDLRPAPLLAAYGWTHFRYACAVSEPPLPALPVVFHMVTYKTGCVWLDVPPGMPRVTGLEWTGENIARLVQHRLRGETINAAVMRLDAWLDERPRERIARCVGLWNAAHAMEVQRGFEGLRVNAQGRLERPAVGGR